MASRTPTLVLRSTSHLLASSSSRRAISSSPSLLAPSPTPSPDQSRPNTGGFSVTSLSSSTPPNRLFDLTSPSSSSSRTPYWSPPPQTPYHHPSLGRGAFMPPPPPSSYAIDPSPQKRWEALADSFAADQKAGIIPTSGDHVSGRTLTFRPGEVGRKMNVFNGIVGRNLVRRSIKLVARFEPKPQQVRRKRRDYHMRKFAVAMQQNVQTIFHLEQRGQMPTIPEQIYPEGAPKPNKKDSNRNKNQKAQD